VPLAACTPVRADRIRRAANPLARQAPVAHPHSTKDQRLPVSVHSLLWMTAHAGSAADNLKKRRSSLIISQFLAGLNTTRRFTLRTFTPSSPRLRLRSRRTLPHCRSMFSSLGARLPRPARMWPDRFSKKDLQASSEFAEIAISYLDLRLRSRQGLEEKSGVIIRVAGVFPHGHARGLFSPAKIRGDAADLQPNMLSRGQRRSRIIAFGEHLGLVAGGALAGI